MNIAIIGAGKLGYRLASALVDGNYAITVIDRKEELLNKISQTLDVMTVHADAREISVLQDIGIDCFQYLITTTGSDETNIIIASFAKALGCKQVFARIRDPEHLNQFGFICETMHIDAVINPDKLITNQIFDYLAQKYTLSGSGSRLFPLGDGLMLRFQAESLPEVLDQEIAEIRKIYPDFIFLSLSRDGKVQIPHGDTVIQRNDTLYVLGPRDQIRDLQRKVLPRKTRKSQRTAMIIGGGKTGFYLSKSLSEAGISVKVIERNQERARYLAANLPDILVLNADGTDIQLLEEENLDDMDAFVTCTGYDEENLLLALTAKHRGAKQVIAKVSHESYKDLTESMGVNMVLNPLDITTSSILRLIQGTERVIAADLIQGQAELLEIIINSRMALSNVPIRDLHLPNGLLIASICRNDQMIIPDGNTRIQMNDRVVIVCMLSSIGEVEKLLKPKLI